MTILIGNDNICNNMTLILQAQTIVFSITLTPPLKFQPHSLVFIFKHGLIISHMTQYSAVFVIFMLPSFSTAGWTALQLSKDTQGNFSIVYSC